MVRLPIGHIQPGLDSTGQDEIGLCGEQQQWLVLLRINNYEPCSSIGWAMYEGTQLVVIHIIYHHSSMREGGGSQPGYKRRYGGQKSNSKINNTSIHVEIMLVPLSCPCFGT